jgi:Domain of unknown function (DUF4349)
MRRLSPPRGRRLVITVVVTALVLAGLFAVVGLLRQHGGASSGASSGGSFSAASPADSLQRVVAGASGEKSQGAPVPMASASAASGHASSSNTSGSTGTTGVDINAAIPPNQGRYLVRTGELDLQLARGTLDRTMQQVTSLTSAFGGYILSSAVGQLPGGSPTPYPAVDNAAGTVQKGVATMPSVVRLDGGTPYAWITLRVPADRFDQAISRFESLGKVQVLTTSAEDVTGQVVDVQARLAHYRAVLARLLTFLNKANTVGSALAVQDRIDQTQLIVEQLSAEQKQLSETVSYSTLSLSLTEKPVKRAIVHHGTGFGHTISHSGWLIGQGAGAILMGLSAALPFIVLVVILALIAYYTARVLRRRREGRTALTGPAGPPAPGESV